MNLTVLFFFLFLILHVILCYFLLIFYFGSSILLSLKFFKLWGLDGDVVFCFDYFSVSFFACVSMISSMVFFYNIFYMSHDLSIRRFSVLVALFVVSMLLLVFSGNFLVTMIGWDGLGLVSFCLVIYYFNSVTLDSGTVTVFSNRIGDCFFLMSFFYFLNSNSLNFSSFYTFESLGLIFLIFLGAITKSAQVPFSAWLPAAMAAPTPVSSLVHSSTLVTAGVYVVIRFNYFFFFLNFFFLKIFFLFTMFLAGMCACFEMDLKKVVAMSTLSQLGMMTFIFSIGLWKLCFLHMSAHAFFKSMLFLSTGSLMHEVDSEQDSRFYGGFTFSYFSNVYFILSGLCLVGFPFFLGFYSKDLILMESSFFGGYLTFFLFFLSCVFTSLYTLRLVFTPFFFLGKASYLMKGESTIFYNCVFLIFSSSICLGGFLWWIEMNDFLIFLSFLDFFFGLIVFGLGLYLVKYLSFLKKILFWFGSILFYRWLSSSFSSKFNKENSFFINEMSWGEVLGGMGVYLFIFSFESYLRILYKVGTGLVFIVVLAYFFF